MFLPNLAKTKKVNKQHWYIIFFAFVFVAISHFFFLVGVCATCVSWALSTWVCVVICCCAIRNILSRAYKTKSGMYLYTVRALADAEVCYRLGCVDAGTKKGAPTDQRYFDCGKHLSRVVCITDFLAECMFHAWFTAPVSKNFVRGRSGVRVACCISPSADGAPRCGHVVRLSWAFSSQADLSVLQFKQVCRNQTT